VKDAEIGGGKFLPFSVPKPKGDNRALYLFSM